MAQPLFGWSQVRHDAPIMVNGELTSTPAEGWPRGRAKRSASRASSTPPAVRSPTVRGWAVIQNWGLQLIANFCPTVTLETDGNPPPLSNPRFTWPAIDNRMIKIAENRANSQDNVSKHLHAIREASRFYRD